MKVFQEIQLKLCLTFVSTSSFTLGVYDGTAHWDGTLQYYNGNSWDRWTGTSTISSFEVNGKYYIQLRGIGNTKITGGEDYLARWVLTGSNIQCNGNIETLLDYQTVQACNHPTMDGYCFANLFYECTSLVKAPELPAITLTDSCYYAMFQGCTSLTHAPELPATNLISGCYCNMFYGCTSLIEAPQLPAIVLANSCYYNMFRGCTSLIQLPELPATTLANMCYYNMFHSCSKIKLSSTKTGEYTQEYRIPSLGTASELASSMTDMFASTGGTFTGTPSINTIYYVSNTNMIVRAHASITSFYDYGTKDLTAGTSKLETGKLYFVYE